MDVVSTIGHETARASQSSARPFGKRSPPSRDASQQTVFAITARLPARFKLPIPNPRRLDQILASLGYCSRREARAFLRNHPVTVEGAPIHQPA
ncbi:MAG: S4 domain-containing protein, partial [Verrucomicrobiota bacterium]